MIAFRVWGRVSPLLVPAERFLKEWIGDGASDPRGVIARLDAHESAITAIRGDISEIKTLLEGRDA
jgi:hypothetical protein